MKAAEYAVIIEQQGKSFGAYVPDLPGCAVVGKSRRAVRASIRKAIGMYLADMVSDGEPVPPPKAQVVWVPQPRLPRTRGAAH
jgi:predicted RNase H-like HicB family nuclease